MTAGTSALANLTVNVFGGAHNLPLLVAEQRGLFARNGLAVELVRTASSADQIQGLIDGRWPIVHTSPDNLLAWRERSGVDLVAWLGGAVGPLVLAARPGVERVEDLRGLTLAVDALDTGFAFVLRALLQAGGLEADDYDLEPLGATHLRWEALREGRTPATLLNLPFTLQARDAGFGLLASHEALLPRLATSVAGARRDWLESHPEAAAAYARSFAAALAWLYDPASHPAAARLLEERYKLAHDPAREIIGILLDPGTGFLPAGQLDVGGLQAAIDLRTTWSGWQPDRTSAYYDLTPYLRAMGALA